MEDEKVRFLQLASIFAGLVPKILLDVLKHHITLSRAFQMRFGRRPWNDDQENREWLANVMKKNPRVKDISCQAVKNNPATEWDVTNLSAALSVVMEPSDVPCDAAVTQACSKRDQPMPHFDISVSERSGCKTWVGFNINVTGASPPEVVECVVTEAPSDTKVVAVCRERANDHDWLKTTKKTMTLNTRPVYLPLPEVQCIVEVRQLRNTICHRSRVEASHNELTQCVASLQYLIEQALRPYIPQGDSDSYLADLNREACTKDFRRALSDKGVLEMTMKKFMQFIELGEVDELCQELKEQAQKFLWEMVPCPPMAEVHFERDTEPQAALLKEQVYDEYRRFMLGVRPWVNVNLVVVEKLPLSPEARSRKPEDVRYGMEAMQQFKHRGVRVTDESTTLITAVDLLKRGSKRIQVVFGLDGSRITTLLKEMCRVFSCYEAESDFDLVLYFPLRDWSVSSAHDLQSILRYYGSEDRRLDHAALAQSMVESNGRGLLFIFDGGDEVKDLLNPSSRSIVQSIIEGCILHEAHIIISCHPGAYASLQDKSAYFYMFRGFHHNTICEVCGRPH